MKSHFLILLLFITSLSLNAQETARDLGIITGVMPVGKTNSIVDVSGVKVGHTTLIKGDAIRTGVTAILPHGGNIFQDKVPAAVFVGNGFGKLAGTTQINELGNIETPIQVNLPPGTGFVLGDGNRSGIAGDAVAVVGLFRTRVGIVRA